MFCVLILIPWGMLPPPSFPLTAIELQVFAEKLLRWALAIFAVSCKATLSPLSGRGQAHPASVPDSRESKRCCHPWQGCCARESNGNWRLHAFWISFCAFKKQNNRGNGKAVLVVSKRHWCFPQLQLVAALLLPWLGLPGSMSLTLWW